MFELNVEHKLSILAMFALIFFWFAFPVPFLLNSSMTFFANFLSSSLTLLLLSLLLFSIPSFKTSNNFALENVASKSALFNLNTQTREEHENERKNTER